MTDTHHCPAGESFPLRLKAAVAGLHDEAEERGPLSAIKQGSVTTGSYRAALLRLHGFVAPMEERLSEAADWPRQGFDYPARQRLPQLLEDLAFLGVDQETLRRAPRRPTPRFTSLHQALGCMYLFEGSRLGGAILADCLDKRFGFGPRGGCAFFGSAGRDAGALWQSFKGFLQDSVSGPDQERLVIDSAVTGFSGLNAWLDGA